jgi:hypothetical protein
MQLQGKSCGIRARKEGVAVGFVSRLTLSAAVALAVSACASSSKNCVRAARSEGEIERDALVACAESFVRDNGFTDAPPNRSRVELDVLTMIEGEPAKRLPSILEERRGSVEPLAYSVCPGAMFSTDGVIVIFRRRKEHLDKGLGVSVERGCHPKLEHLPAPLFESYEVKTGCDSVRRIAAH